MKVLQKSTSNLKIVEKVEESDMDRLIMVILLVVFPPLAVLLKSNGFRTPVFLNSCLYLLFVVPAYFHGVWYCFVEERKNTIFPTNTIPGTNLHQNMSLSSISAAINHKDVEVY